MTREKFLEFIIARLKESIACVHTAIKYGAEKGVRREEINGILLKEILLECFQKDDSFVGSDLDPDLVVARGAVWSSRARKDASCLTSAPLEFG